MCERLLSLVKQIASLDKALVLKQFIPDLAQQTSKSEIDMG